MEEIAPPPPSVWPFKGPLIALVFLFFVVFAGLRIYQLNVRPLHNDEGVNAWFLTNLIKSNNYRYDPLNYHGPSLYYIQLIPTWINTLIKTGPIHFSIHRIDGLTDWSIRGVTVAAGLILLLSLLFTFNRIGTWGAFTAFILAGFSCNMLYFSRYFIHETFFVLFTLWFYLGSTWYLDTRKPAYFYLLVISAALIFCTKETSVVTYFVLGFSVLCAEATYTRLAHLKSAPVGILLNRNYGWLVEGLFNKYTGASVLAVGLWFLLYTSFFTNFAGLADSIRTYAKWTHEGVESGHNKPFLYFIQKVLVPYEAGTVLLSLLGLVTAFHRNNKHGLYLAYWTLGTVGAYSLIPYKTVWCVITLLLPMSLLAGYGVQAVVQKIQERMTTNKIPWTVLIAAGVVALAVAQFRQTWQVVYVDYDKEYYEPPYVHTSRDIFNLLAEIEKLADHSPMGHDIKINVVTPVYWPLPYYLRDYSQALFWGKIQGPPNLDAPLLLAEKSQQEQLDGILKDPYIKHEYTVRTNSAAVLYINQKLFGGLFPEPPPIPHFFPAAASQISKQPGLMKNVFRDRRVQGAPVKSGLELREVKFLWDKEVDKPLFSPFLIRWDGFINAPRSGAYGFSLESDDGSELWIDGALVVNNSGTHTLKKSGTQINLEQGFHRIALEYFDSGGSASLSWTWVPPGSQEELVPAAAFFHQDPFASARDEQGKHEQ